MIKSGVTITELALTAALYTVLQMHSDIYITGKKQAKGIQKFLTNYTDQTNKLHGPNRDTADVY